jgi:CDP-diacylglycerol--glycerol-3-phosphate 3-phosphatidyltransferase
VNLPNFLTLSRIFIVPLLVVVLLTRFPGDWFGISQQVIGVSIFLAASLTDLLDGMLARRRGQVTTLGILLDPIADKLLIAAALISLVENHLAPAWAVVIIIGREFAVTGFRSIAAAEGVHIPASRAGKLKMVSQVCAITLLILGSDMNAPRGISLAPVTGNVMPFVKEVLAKVGHESLNFADLKILSYGAGRAMLWIVVFSAIYSMVGYFRQFYGKLRGRIQVRQRRRLRLMARRRARRIARMKTPDVGPEPSPSDI